MLIDFRLKNYKSFKDEQSISFVASPKDEYLSNLIDCESSIGIKLLPSIVMYGANASGKTNIINALYFCRNFIRKSARYENDQGIPVKPFLLDESSFKEPSEFEFSFVVDNTRYQYGFILNKKHVLEEWLYSYPKGRVRRLFTRKKQNKSDDFDYKFSSYLKGDKEKIKEITSKNSLFLSTAATLKNKQLTTIFDWFINHLKGTRARDLNVHMFKNLIEDKNYLNQVREFIKFADFGVVDISVKDKKLKIDLDEDMPDDMPDSIKNLAEAINKFYQESADEFDDEPSRLMISMVHSKGDDKVPFPLEEESAGTIQFFSLSFPILHALKNGSVIFVDELDSSLHPLLVKSIIDLFNDPNINKNGAQLIFNTHDTTLLNLSVFRRDQIWFVEKDKNGVSHIYSLLEFSPRKTEALEKGYLQGRYGAIPFIGTFPCEVL